MKFKQIKKFFNTYIMYFIIVLLSLIVSIPFILYNKYFPNDIISDHEPWGQFGDFIGGVLNPFLTFVSFLGLLYTLRKQIEQNKRSEDSRKISDLTNTLMLLEKTIEPKLQHVIFRKFTLPKKSVFRYTQAENLKSDLELCRSLLEQLKLIQKDTSLSSFYSHKYKEVIDFLKNKEYLEEDFKVF